MSLKPITSAAQARRVIVYDLEWVPGEDTRPGWQPMALRMVGTYDGLRYRWFRTIAEFFDAVLIPSNTGAWIYAHAGGMADIQYVFDHIIKHAHEYQVEASFSGSSAIIVNITKGRHKWTFVDSYWLIREGLRKIASWVGMEKGGADDSLDIFYANLAELATYNEQDCVILWKAIRIFEQIVLDFGGELQKTIASTALNLFRRRFLTQEIPTNDALNVLARESYVASRVEVFAAKCGSANYYDINSSFPFSMLKAVPGAMTGRSKRLPDSGLYLAKVRVQVPDQYVPPLPYRHPKTGRVYFPTGEWEAWFTSTDVALLYECGGRVLKVIDVLHFEPFYDLEGYASTVYEARRKTTNAALKVVYKYLLNSLYGLPPGVSALGGQAPRFGKFAESGEKEKVLIFPDSTHCPHTPAHDGDSCLRMYAPGIWLLSETISIPHAHVPISSAITAESRASLTRYMRRCSEVYYVDTDAFECPDTFETSDALGGLKLEKRIEPDPKLDGTDMEGIGAMHEGPKLYAFHARDPNDAASLPKWTVRAKGFRKLDLADYRALVSTRHNDSADTAISVHRMARIKENLLLGDTAPRELEVVKRLRPIQGKRSTSGENTRPWNVGEIR